MKLIFCLQINVIETIIIDVCGQPCPNYPKMQYFKKELSGVVDFLQTDKHESFMILIGMIKHSQNSQNNVFTVPQKRS